MRLPRLRARIPTVNPRIAALHFTPRRGERAESVPELCLEEDFGAVRDHHSRPASSRQILLMDLETLLELGLAPGTLKENITTEGLSFPQLASGGRWKLGEEVLLEITKPCHPCRLMDEIRPRLQATLQDRRGWLARVLRGGIIRVGDAIQAVEE